MRFENDDEPIKRESSPARSTEDLKQDVKRALQGTTLFIFNFDSLYFQMDNREAGS
jgi:hypothetical protein